MVKSRKNYTKKSGRASIFQKEITVKFLELLMMIKLFHWKTLSYATHKATDELYSKLNEHIDTFVEILLGKTGVRTNLLNKHKISLIDLSNKEQLMNKINYYKSYMVDLSHNPFIRSMSNTDLLNVRDEILGDLNQFMYLLTLD
jgi:DNA-binding ferritin-like protein